MGYSDISPPAGTSGGPGLAVYALCIQYLSFDQQSASREATPMTPDEQFLAEIGNSGSTARCSWRRNIS